MDSKFILGDALQIMPTLPDNFFSLILADPPYNMSKKNNFHTMNRAGIDFGEWDKDFDQQAWIPKAIPLLKPGGSIIIWNDWKNMTNIHNYLINEGILVKRMLTWFKPNPPAFNCKRLFLQGTEHAIWGVKPGAKWTFNSNYHKGVFQYGRQKSFHKTRKNSNLYKELIEILTNPEDYVLDPFGGSCPTITACKETNRNFICIENDSEIYNNAIQELKK